MRQTPTINKILRPDLFILIYVLLTLIVIYQRTLLFDGALWVFEIINDENFYWTHNRYINVITQIIPLILVKLRAPIQAIVLSYALFYILTPVVVFYILRRIYRNLLLEWAFVINLFFFTSAVFYFPNSEIQLGIYLLFMLFILLYSAEQVDLKFSGLLAALIFGIIICQEVLILPLIFTLAALFICIRKRRVQTLVASGVLAFFLLLKKLFFLGDYPVTRVEALSWNSVTAIFEPASLLHQIAYSLININVAALILMVVIFLIGFQLNRKKEALVILGMIALHILIVSIADSIMDYNQYVEHHLKPIGYYLGIGLFLVMRERHKKLNKVSLVLSLLLFVNALFILSNGVFYKNLYNGYNKMVEVAREANTDKAVFMIPTCDKWNCFEIPYLTLISSQLKGGEPVVCFIVADSLELAEYEAGYFVTKAQKTPLNDINQHYFKLSEADYKLIENVDPSIIEQSTARLPFVRRFYD